MSECLSIAVGNSSSVLEFDLQFLNATFENSGVIPPCHLEDFCRRRSQLAFGLQHTAKDRFGILGSSLWEQSRKVRIGIRAHAFHRALPVAYTA